MLLSQLLLVLLFAGLILNIFIQKIPLLASQDEKLPVPFKRIQFPIRLCFAMTINKAQGQTLDFVGIYLREPVFYTDNFMLLHLEQNVQRT